MYNNLQNIAEKACLQAGKVLTDHFENRKHLKVKEKSANDFVSQVDLLAEQEILDCIQKYFPEHGFIAEESGIERPQSEFQWVIDPLDGTTNYLHGIEHFAVAVACLHKNKLACGVVYDPMKQQLFSASRGSGARLNNRRIRVVQHHQLSGGLFATGIPFSDNQKKSIQPCMQTMEAVLQHGTRGIRRLGTASLDIVYVANGTFQGFWEANLKIWDIAAAACIALEAGAMVSDFEGRDNYLKSGNIIAADNKTMLSLQKIIATHYNANECSD